MTNANTIRQAIADEAAKRGYTLDYSDMRRGLFFLKRGTEVRSSGAAGRITAPMIETLVQMTIVAGRRCDLIKDSRYYNPQA